MLEAPRLPTVVQAVNWSGAQLRRLGLKISLEESALLEVARRRAGLCDFGAPFFREGLRRLLAGLEQEAALHTLGRFIARTRLVQLLVNRLQMEEVHRWHPRIIWGPIRRPLFIIGMPRTGTSILHELLAQDPQNRTPHSWEVARPCPPPELATCETDPRIALVDAELAQTDRLIPGFKKIHPMGARLPQECVAMMAHDFTSLFFSTVYRLPGYSRWLLEEADLAPVYAAHRRLAQLLQWRRPAEHWVFKSPGHLWALPALLAEYPDAFLVQIHRDPIMLLASMTSLSVTLRAMTSSRVEAGALGREWSERLALALERSVEARKSGLLRAEQVLDLSFDELTADPIGCIREIYRRCDRALGPAAEAAMRGFLEHNPADKHGRHDYRFSDTGLELEEERRRTRRYREHFRVREEPVR